ncbi:retrovirus-related pol polyprotein from transposon TNT 1-94 [Tanacetum coccineum]
MLLAMKDEAESNLNDEENDFMLDNSFRDETLEELTAAIIMMARIQPADDNAVHERKNHGKRKTIINTSNDVHIDSNIIFDDPYVENNETCDELEREICADKDTIERILKEKDKIESEFFKVENEKLIIQHETQLAKKAFKEREDRYLKDIVDLEEKLSSHDKIVYKIGQSIQIIHMLGKTPNQVYDPFLKAGLGYKNPKRLKKAITTQQKMYHGEKLCSTKLKIDSPDYEETLEDAKESRLKMRNKMVQLYYNKLNALYETFVPQKESSVVQTYFLIPYTYNIYFESNKVKTDSQIPKMPKESKLLKMALAINALRDRIDVTLLEDRKGRWMCISQNSLREFYKTNVIPMSVSLSKTLKELKQEFMEEVREMLNIFESIEQKKNELLENEIEKISNDSKDIQANLLKRIKILKNDFKRSQAQSIDFELKLQHQKEKMACDVSWKSRLSKLNYENVIQLVFWIVDSGCSKHMTSNFQLLRNFVKKFIGTVRFGNDHFAAITGYGDYVQGNLTICHVYHAEGLGHNLFLVGQFCDEDLDAAFLSTLSPFFELAASSPVCLMSKTTSTKSWLWHRRLSHLNFSTINQLTSNDLVDGLSKFKYDKDHICSACEQGKSNKASFLSKLVPSIESKLELIHMDLCGPMRVESINGKKYILMIIDDYS